MASKLFSEDVIDFVRVVRVVRVARMVDISRSHLKAVCVKCDSTTSETFLEQAHNSSENATCTTTWSEIVTNVLKHFASIDPYTSIAGVATPFHARAW